VRDYHAAFRQDLGDLGYVDGRGVIIEARYADNQYDRLGAVVAYGAETDDLCRPSATLVNRILKGARPADLPVEQATKFELFVNLKTAKALGLTIPPSVLARADEVIQ
jgi:putative ABC transport system substrate-binding protein